MPRLIVFPCPNCGASQNVEEGAVSTQCQFCGNTISVPEELRPKAPLAQPAAFPGTSSPQVISIGGMGNVPGMTNLPGMFLNMDIGKLKAMALAARAGDKAEAALLYGEAFGVGPEEAMQAAELMAAHHPVVLSHIQMSAPRVIQMGSMPVSTPISSPTPIYNLPSPPVTGGRSGTSGRWAACVTVAVVLLIAVVLAGAVIVMAVARAR